MQMKRHDDDDQVPPHEAEQQCRECSDAHVPHPQGGIGGEDAASQISAEPHQIQQLMAPCSAQLARFPATARAYAVEMRSGPL
jgi:hypothetical protein